MDAAEKDRKRARLREIIQTRSFSTGEFKLASGAGSNYYFDMKPTMLDPEGADLISDLILDALDAAPPDAVGGLAYGAIPLVVATAQKSAIVGRPIQACYVRKEQKERGAEKLIDGNMPDGGEVVVLEDVTTKGGSAMRAVEALREAGCTVTRVVSIVDRLEGARDFLTQNGIALTSLFTRDDFSA